MEKLKKFGLVGVVALGLIAGTSYAGANQSEQAYDACESWYYTDC
ncbi:hypothetical protein [Pontibacillus yanchengensis]|nr:hypothetical protein [Pontibacillus yanchengensis]